MGWMFIQFCSAKLEGEGNIKFTIKNNNFDLRHVSSSRGTEGVDRRSCRKNWMIVVKDSRVKHGNDMLEMVLRSFLDSPEDDDR